LYANRANYKNFAVFFSLTRLAYFWLFLSIFLDGCGALLVVAPTRPRVSWCTCIGGGVWRLEALVSVTPFDFGAAYENSFQCMLHGNLHPLN
jgi:hypothetical protein